MLKFLGKIFGSSSSVAVPQAKGDERDLVSFVRYVTSSLVEKPSSISVDSVNKNNNLNINIRCRKEDIGKLIGKNGKTIEAIRSLVNGASGRIGKRVRVEIVE